MSSSLGAPVQRRKTVLLARPRHLPGDGETVLVQNPVPPAIMILAAAMQNIGPAGAKIERMKQAAIRMAHHPGGWSIDDQMIAAGDRTLISTETKIALFVMDQPVVRWREIRPSRQPARQSQTCVADPPRDAPSPG